MNEAKETEAAKPSGASIPGPLPCDVSDAPKLRYHLDKLMNWIDNLKKQYGV